jgi:8-oxo-dGTP diphosphatase
MNKHDLPVLAEITEASLGMPERTEKMEGPYRKRRAVRALMFNAEGKIAVLHARNDGYHKLPGGGVESIGHDVYEDNEICLRRETKEETGYDVHMRGPVGQIAEIKDETQMLQISDCYIADVVGQQGEINLMEDEQAAGLAVEWMTIDEAIAVMGKDTPPGYLGKFILARDLIFLQTGKEILKVQQETRGDMKRLFASPVPADKEYIAV